MFLEAASVGMAESRKRKSPTEDNEKYVATAVKSYMASKPSHSLRAYRDCNRVAQDRIHSERVTKEVTTARLWEERWSFMSEVKQQRPQSAPAQQKKWDFFDDKRTPDVPLTTQGDIGKSLRRPSTAVTSMRRFEMNDHKPKKVTDIGKINFG